MAAANVLVVKGGLCSGLWQDSSRDKFERESSPSDVKSEKDGDGTGEMLGLRWL